MSDNEQPIGEPPFSARAPVDRGLIVDDVGAQHPHEPEIARQLDDEGRCLVCGLIATQETVDAALRAENADLRQQRDAWKDHKLSDAEAQAISACIKALTAFQETNRGSYSATTIVGTESIRRVLDFLAARYGITRHNELAQLEQAVSVLTDEIRRRPSPTPVPWTPPVPPPGTSAPGFPPGTFTI